MIELTLEQVKKSPAMFMYAVGATDKFLNAIQKKYANIIREKRANQQYILLLSARKFIDSNATVASDAYKQYIDAVKTSFADTYGITPAQALIKLAQGKTVAGKDWDKGVFGVGALKSSSFAGTDITVNPDNGYMMRDGKYLPVYDTDYDDIKGKTIAFHLYYYDEATGRTYMSEYDKTTKKYYAKTYSTSDGSLFSYSGKAVSAKDSSDIWSNIKLDWEWLKNIINWILSIFGIKTSDTGAETEMLSVKNTAPSQTADGFCITESGFSEAATIALIAVAAGTLLMGGMKKKSVK